VKVFQRVEGEEEEEEKKKKRKKEKKERTRKKKEGRLTELVISCVQTAF
jgi:hypothetical protein